MMMAGGAVVSSGGGLSLGVWDVLGRSVDALGGEGSGEEGTEMLVKWTSSPLMFFSGSCVYLLLVMLLRKAMLARREGAYKLAGAMRVYNVMQVLLNLNLLLRFLITAKFDLLGPHYIFFINNPFTTQMKLNICIHYLSKYLDFLDTVFIVLRRKDSQLSFLHVYHHATIGLIWGYLLHIGYGNGTAGFGAFINSVVHFFMYGHYLVSSFGVRNPLKVFITQFQIVQFYLCLAHVPLVLFVDNYIPAYLCYLQMAYHITMVVLFSSFYQRTYKSKAQLDVNGKAAHKTGGRAVRAANGTRDDAKTTQSGPRTRSAAKKHDE